MYIVIVGQWLIRCLMSFRLVLCSKSTWDFLSIILPFINLSNMRLNESIEQNGTQFLDGLLDESTRCSSTTGCLVASNYRIRWWVFYEVVVSGFSLPLVLFTFYSLFVLKSMQINKNNYMKSDTNETKLLNIHENQLGGNMSCKSTTIKEEPLVTRWTESPNGKFGWTSYSRKMHSYNPRKKCALHLKLNASSDLNGLPRKNGGRGTREVERRSMMENWRQEAASGKGWKAS